MNAASRAPWIVAAGGLALATAVFTLGPYPDLVAALEGARPFDEAPAASLGEAQRRLDAMAPPTRALYAAHLRWDLLAMVANAALLGGLLVALARAHPRLARALLAAPAILLLADALENAILATWLARGPGEATVALAAAATTVKLAAFAVATAAIGALATVALARRVLRSTLRAVSAR